MADREFKRDIGTLVSGERHVHARLTFGASGAVTLQRWQAAKATYTAAGAAGNGNGILSVTQVDSTTGVYDLVLGGAQSAGGATTKDRYRRLVFAQAFMGGASGTSTVTKVTHDTDVTDVDAATPTVRLCCFDAADAAVDPGSGEEMLVHLVLQNSSGE